MIPVQAQEAQYSEVRAGQRGFCLIDKPQGCSSFKVVQWVRRQSGEKKVGHAGTLDPFATGLLIVAIGREFTRQLSEFEGMDKVYEAEFVFGRSTDTLDPDGKQMFNDPDFRLNEVALHAAMQKWTGELLQVPPAFSAIHVQGQRAYDLARRGAVVTLGPRSVTIHSITSTGPVTVTDGFPTVAVRVCCGKGTYIRALARDLALELGTQGYCHKLRRTAIGEYKVEQAMVPCLNE